MGLSGEGEEEISYQKHTDLCNELNMDRDSSNEAWLSYSNIRQNYTLEGDQLHWLGCALYVACRKSTAPTVGRASTLVEGNLVSLTRLLRLCNLSLIQFFSKSKKWADMTNLAEEFRKKINRLERNFAVSMVIFKKFQPIFNEMFVEPTNEQPRQQKSKKSRNLPCSPSKLFDFVWTLFICVKSELPETSDDLVNSYHMLLACCDLVFANVVMADRTDLLNNKFPGLPKTYGERSYKPPTDPPCIIQHLCQLHDGIVLEAKGIKEYCWKNQMRKLFDRKVLKGDQKTFSQLLDMNNFELNFKAINKLYEEYVLSVGDFDERIFLAKNKELRIDKATVGSSQFICPERTALRTLNHSGDDANAEIGTPTKIFGSSGIGDISEKLEAKRNLNQRFQSSLSQLTTSTPLTGRKYLKSKEPASNVTPVSTATQSVQRLQSLLAGRTNTPSTFLSQIIKNCDEEPLIVERVKMLGEKFCAEYTQSYPGPRMDFAQKRLQLAETLFYKLLENILRDEMKKPNFDCNTLLRHDMFQQTLFACCLEIVIYSYNSQRTFPWVLEALDIEPYHFYKVIEVTVRAEDQLSRDMVKHLNLIEEQILESLVWKGDSPLWDIIEMSELSVPTCEEVSLPHQLSEDLPTPTPLSNPAIRRLVMPGMTQSPTPSASERFHSPVASAIAKKKLFIDSSRGVCTPGQSVLNPQNKPKLPESNERRGSNGGSVIINPASLKEKQAAVVKPNKPRRTGSLGLFFRKFYHLASVRMQELCNHLQVCDAELRRKIWTCFEHSIVEHTDLMLDRHLDQILMCAVYVICKSSSYDNLLSVLIQNFLLSPDLPADPLLHEYNIEGLDKPFTEVMKCYRLQPQSASHVYRSVLLASRHPRVNKNSSTDNQENAESDCTKPEERCDIIKFYNSVYVQKVQNFVRKFANGNAQNISLTLSPLPVSRSVPMSPRRRISDTHSVFIRPLISSEPKVFPVSPSKPLSYCFSRSPAKSSSYDNLFSLLIQNFLLSPDLPADPLLHEHNDLRAINTMMRESSESVRRIGKRLLNDDGIEDSASPAKQPNFVASKIQDLFADRLIAKSQDSSSSS